MQPSRNTQQSQKKLTKRKQKAKASASKFFELSQHPPAFTRFSLSCDASARVSSKLDASCKRVVNKKKEKKNLSRSLYPSCYARVRDKDAPFACILLRWRCSTLSWASHFARTMCDQHFALYCYTIYLFVSNAWKSRVPHELLSILRLELLAASRLTWLVNKMIRWTRMRRLLASE